VISAAHRPNQLDGYNCGAITVRAIEYLIAGVPMTFKQDTMEKYRFKILLALKIGAFHWLVPTLPPLVEEETIKQIAAVPRRIRTAGLVVDPEVDANREEARAARRALTTMIEAQGTEVVEEGWSQAY
jgi:hypothetical protein